MFELIIQLELSKSTTEDDIKEAFNELGYDVTEIQLKRSKIANHAFVKTRTTTEAADVIAHFTNDPNAMISRVQLATMNTKLHIGNLNLSVSREDLAALFRQFGELHEDETQIFRTGRGLNFGSVHFLKHEDAAEAKLKLAGGLFQEKALHVEWNLITSNRQKYADSSGYARTGYYHSHDHQNYHQSGIGSGESDPVISLYVQFETVEESICVEEEVLKNIFSQFGNVTNVSIKNFNIDPYSSQQRGYAFVHYPSTPAGRDSAYAAVLSSERDVIIQGIRLTIEFSKNFRKAVAQLESGAYYHRGTA